MSESQRGQDAVLYAITRAGGCLARGEIIRTTGLPPHQLDSHIKPLLIAGILVGDKGMRYRIADDLNGSAKVRVADAYSAQMWAALDAFQGLPPEDAARVFGELVATAPQPVLDVYRNMACEELIA